MEDHGKMQLTKSNKLVPSQIDSNVVIIYITMKHNIVLVNFKLISLS